MNLLAHVGAPLAPHDLPTAWAFDPVLLAGLAAAGWCYGVGLRRLWRAAGTGKVVSRGQAAAFAGGGLALLAALVTPLEALSAALFSAHMAQHLLLVLVAAPLLALSAPLQTMAWGLPPSQRRRTARGHGRLRRLLDRPALPLLAAAAYTVTLSLWHVPAAYDAALRSEPVHLAEHATLLAAALGLWFPVAHPRRTPVGLRLLMLFVATVQGGILAALLTFAPRAWYAYAPSTAAWGLSPLADQQLAGALMWVPGGIVYIVSAALVVACWLRDERLALSRREHGAPPKIAAAHPAPTHEA